MRRFRGESLWRVDELMLSEGPSAFAFCMFCLVRSEKCGSIVFVLCCRRHQVERTRQLSAKGISLTWKTLVRCVPRIGKAKEGFIATRQNKDFATSFVCVVNGRVVEKAH